MSNILKWAGILIVGSILLLSIGSVTGVISIGFIQEISVGSWWENNRNNLALLIMHSLIILGLLGQIDQIMRTRTSMLTDIATLGMMLLCIIVPFQGGVIPSIAVVVGGGVLLMALIALGLASIVDTTVAYMLKATNPIMLIGLLVICTPALSCTFLISSIASWSILGISLMLKHGSPQKIKTQKE
jgi:hypothetical protein